MISKFQRKIGYLARFVNSTQLSRKRRKLYEDLLEEKYNDLNNQYKQEIQKLNLNNSLSDKMKKYISFLRQKKVIESKMEESMARDALDKEVIGKILMDGVLYRLGPKGHTRESLCNLLINMIIDEIFPEPYKFVFCLLNQDGSGGWSANSEWDKLNSLLHEDQVKLMRERFGPEVLAIKSRYNKTITRLTNLKNNILEDQKEVESLLHQAANVISSTKRSNYVNFIEFSILGNEKLDTFLEENEDADVLKKRKPLAGQPNADPKENELDGFLLSQLKQRRLKANKRSNKPKNSEPAPATNGKEGKQAKKSSQEDSMKDYLDMKRDLV